ncbi:inositol monophosphatase family protein [Carnobacterium gallinarum]|uniref:inositol monophosphatase family protein n=1 Tax=Carnobacterium gallinarum TaxID=2749 RepID=UPI00068F2AFA|nr:inositol monophosphatase family protein [Carnobacterium gallinarum]
MITQQDMDKMIRGWIQEAAEAIKQSFSTELIIAEKSDRNDLVTNMDKATEIFFIEKIRHYFPEDRILGEEGNGDSIEDLAGRVWIIDPIDGTLNFVKQQADFAIMIGFYQDGVGKMGYIYDVMADEFYWGIKGEGAFLNGERLPKVKDISLREGLIALSSGMIGSSKYSSREMVIASSGVRMLGSAGVETARVVMGRMAAYITHRLQPWDIAAGKVIAEEVGLMYTQLNGEPIDLLTKSATLVATPSAHQEIVTIYLKNQK